MYVPWVNARAHYYLSGVQVCVCVYAWISRYTHECTNTCTSIYKYTRWFIFTHIDTHTHTCTPDALKRMWYSSSWCPGYLKIDCTVPCVMYKYTFIRVMLTAPCPASCINAYWFASYLLRRVIYMSCILRRVIYMSCILHTTPCPLCHIYILTAPCPVSCINTYSFVSCWLHCALRHV